MVVAGAGSLPRGFPGEEGTSPPQATNDPLLALCFVARVHQVAAEPVSLRHAMGLAAAEPLGSHHLVMAARHIGLKAKVVRTTLERLPHLSLPALVVLRGGQAAENASVAVLARVDGERVLLHDPAKGRPVIEPVDTFARQWTGEVILIASRATLAAELSQFDFSWFIPSLVKHRRLLGEVLLISFMLQLFALVSPLFFQVVMDKVLVHRGLTTLDVLIIGLLVVVVFESVLSYLRTYVFSHTTSRIDVELGSRLFRHLLQLPLSYFQARRAGDSVARVRELENIRSFLTGNALTVVLDVFFCGVFIAVMFFYSATLTLIVLVSIPLYLAVSLFIVPVLRRRLDEKFARGAENQAMLVEIRASLQLAAGLLVAGVEHVANAQQIAGTNFLDCEEASLCNVEEDAYWLKGGEGNDTLRGATGDTLEGGRGNDRFETNERDDVGPKVLKLALGDGQDVWRSDGFDWSALDDLVIDFGPGVKPESVFAEWVRTSPTLAGENHLVLHYGDLGDSLTLESVAIVAGELKADAQLRFADGTDTRLPEKIRSAAVTPETDGDDLIVDTPLGSTIESGRGNDRVVLFSGTYVYHAGHGKDVVDTYYGTIELADVTQVSQLSFDWVAGQDSGWRIGFAGREDSLFLRYDGVGYFSPTLRLGNGETVRIPPPPRYGTEGNDDLSAIGTADWNIHALAGNDTVSSGSGNDLLSGDAGNDWIRAGDGNDVVFFDRGDGVDTLDLEDFAAAVDTLRFGQGISERDVALQRYGDDLYVRLNGGADAVWVRKHFVKVPSDGSYERNYGLDRIEFSSGVQWDATTIQAMVDRAANNHAPTVKTYLPTLKATADKVFTYTMASDVIVDPDAWDVVTYRMTRPDGSDMPAWLRFDADTRTLTATPTAAQVGDQWFVLWGTDLQGMSVGQYLGLSVAATPAGPSQLSPQASARLTPAGADYDTPQRYDPASGNADMLRFLEGVAADQAWFRLGASQREFSAIGTGNEASLANGYSGNQYPMEWLGAGGEGALLVSQVNNLVSAMVAFAPPPAGQTTLPPDRTQSPAMVLAANWH